MRQFDVVVIGAGAAGLMCAAVAGARNRSVLLLDHTNKAGKKILLSGGGCCNFTNRYTTPQNYLSKNPHFCISALKRFSQHDFEALVQKYHIPYHEKKHGQLFCERSAKDIAELLLEECRQGKVQIRLNYEVNDIKKTDAGFVIDTAQDTLACQSLVIATGGLSFPTMGASSFGYKLAEQFGLKVHPVRAALVPLTLHSEDLVKLSPLSGISLPVEVRVNQQVFAEDMLFTHRGLSGPAILQISSYWHPGDRLHINLLPEQNAFDFLTLNKQLRPLAELKTVLSQVFPARFAEILCTHWLGSKAMNQYQEKELASLAKSLQNWEIKPNATEGYRTAEVTLGGVDTDAISSKTFEVQTVPGLYFIGEVLDVTGQLGGFNFQWAWASGYCCGLYV